MRDETKCVRSGYKPKNGEPGVMPIVQSTTYVFDTAEEIGDLFNFPNAHMYSRFSNPTVDCVEKKIADLEGGVAAMCTSSGQMASMMSILNLCKSGDSFIAASAIYGGTVNLFAVTLEKLGIECIFIDQDAPEEEINAKFKPNTRAVFGETLANPALSVFDIEKFAKIAHAHGVPLIIDNTFATPVLCKPFDFGADIVVHSTTKYMDGHALQGGGVIVDGGRFNWANGKFPEFTEPDESYHGFVYTEKFGSAAYIGKARMQLMRDYGAYPSAFAGFLLNIGLETLAVRMERYCQNAQKVAEYLCTRNEIETVRYPGLKTDRFHELAQKYLPTGCSGVISFDVRGGRETAAKLMNAFKLASREVHVADIRTCVLHPASMTHRQLTDEQLVAAGINAGMVRFSCGLENADDIIEDIEQALTAIK